MSEWFAFTIFLIVMQLISLVGAILLAKKNKGFLTVVFFAFGMASGLFSSLFWIAFDLLYHDMRMPIAANEIGEWAMFLLFGSCLTTIWAAREFIFSREVLFTALFAAASTGLWIAWSGEWIKDILTGLCFGWFLCCTVGALKKTGELKKGEWFGLGVGALLLVCGQTATFFVPETVVQPLDIFCYVLMFSGIGFFILHTVLAIKRGKSGLAPAFSLFAWATSTMYMSSDGYYFAALIISALSFPVLLYALKKEVTKA